MPIFSVVDIDEKLFDAAFALVHTVMPDISADQWRDYARNARLRGGLLGLVGPRRELFGFLTYRDEHSLRYGRTLHIDHFVTFELSRSAPGRKALYEAAEALAREWGCEAIELRLEKTGIAHGASSKAQTWFDLGCSLDSMVFAKSLLPGTAAAASPLSGRAAHRCLMPAAGTRGCS